MHPVAPLLQADKICANCNIDESTLLIATARKLNACIFCGKVFYCSDACKANDSRVHKYICKQMLLEEYTKQFNSYLSEVEKINTQAAELSKKSLNEAAELLKNFAPYHPELQKILQLVITANSAGQTVQNNTNAIIQKSKTLVAEFQTGDAWYSGADYCFELLVNKKV